MISIRFKKLKGYVAIPVSRKCHHASNRVGVLTESALDRWSLEFMSGKCYAWVKTYIRSEGCEFHLVCGFWRERFDGSRATI